MSAPTLDDFYEGRRSSVLPFVVNDAVRIKEGRRKGDLAAVVCIEESDPELKFQVEYSDGVLEVLAFSVLELIPENEKRA
jgi:hypothetical protein